MKNILLYLLLISFGTSYGQTKAEINTYKSTDGSIWKKTVDNQGRNVNVKVSSATIDVIAPTITVRGTNNATTIRYTFSEPVTATTAGFSFTKNGSNLSISSVSGSGTIWTFTVPTVAYGDVLLGSYNSGTGNTLDANGNELVTFSGVTVTNNLPPPADVTAPTVPSGLSSSSIGQNSFTLSWNASTDAVGVTQYEVFKGGVSYGTTASTSLAITGLTAATQYSMTVRARDAAANYSAQSSALSVTTASAPTAGAIDGHATAGQSNVGWVWASDMTDAEAAIYRQPAVNSMFYNGEVQAPGYTNWGAVNSWIRVGHNTQVSDGFITWNSPGFNTNGNINYQTDSGGHFGMIGPLAIRLNAYQPRLRYFFQNGKGGSSLAVDWKVNTGARWTQLRDRLAEWAALANTAGNSIVLKSFTWNQGEEDANNGNTAMANAYGVNLDEFISWFRTYWYGIETTYGWAHSEPLVIIPLTKASWPGYAAVNSAKTTYAAAHSSNTVTVNTVDETTYPTNPNDGQHWSATAQINFSGTVFNLIKDR